MPQNNASRFKGLLTIEEVDKYHTCLKQACQEWEIDIWLTAMPALVHNLPIISQNIKNFDPIAGLNCINPYEI